MDEYVVYAAAADGSACTWGLTTLALHASYRDMPLARRGCTSPAQLTSFSLGMCCRTLAACVKDKSAIALIDWTVGGAPLRCAAPEPLLCLAAAPDGSLLAGGGASGRLYLWSAGSGELLRAWGGHYKAVTALSFSPCGSVLASGGGDGLLHLWDSAIAADIATSAASVGPGGAAGGAVLAPAVTWSEHSLTITALAWGPTAGGGGGGLSAPLLSASADRTVRAWDAASRLPLAVLSFPAPVTALALDGSTALGPFVFAGCDDGSIHATPLQPGRAAGGSSSSSGGGDAASSSSSASSSSAASVSFAGHAGPVTDLALAPPCMGSTRTTGGSAASSSSSSAGAAAGGAGVGAGAGAGPATGARLVSAGADGLVRIWEPRSGQQIAALDPARAAAAAGSAASSSAGAGASSGPSSGSGAASAGVVALLLARADRVAPPPASGSSGRSAGGGAGLGADGTGALGLGAHAAGLADPIGAAAAGGGWGAAFLAPPRKFARPLPPGWLDGSGGSGAGSAAGPADADILVRILPSVASAAGGSVPLAADAGAGAFAEPAAGTAVDAAAHAASSLQNVIAALEAAAAVAAAKGLPVGPPAAMPSGADAAALAASQAEAAALRERVAALENENARWRAVNSKLAERLQGQTAAAAGAGAGAGAAAPATSAAAAAPAAPSAASASPAVGSKRSR